MEKKIWTQNIKKQPNRKKKKNKDLKEYQTKPRIHALTSTSLKSFVRDEDRYWFIDSAVLGI